ncbi:MAG: magnesium-translocating P-type ATPase, partial [Candidatus Melainabacteria bacterium]|nr:magnesium-translocating P-type ATPase [Candidatus Melainabacteria bacterium]
MTEAEHPFWSLKAEELLHTLNTSSQGLNQSEARRRLKQYGANRLVHAKRHTLLSLFLSQFKSPLILLLLFAATLSLFLRDRTDAIIIMIIVFASSILSFFQEKGAVRAVEKLVSLVKIRTTVLREGKSIDVEMENVVPGDIILFNAGDIVPSDCLILESKDCFVDESSLTGESFHVEKKAGALPAKTALRERENVLYMGSNIFSGTAKALVVKTGKETEFGKVSEHLKVRVPETSFEHGVRYFGYLLLEVTLILVLTIFAFNVYLQRPVLESFLFAMALAVGLTPQLLPAIISINLAHGAKRMAKEKVIVKRLSSIENIGSMNILCSDKTGTLTHGVIELFGAMNIHGSPSETALRSAYLNAALQSGYTNEIDKSVLKKQKLDISGWNKVDEVPYDFTRKRISILAKGPDGLQMLTKGAFQSVLAICSEEQNEDGSRQPLKREALQEQFEKFCAQGYRVLGIASKTIIKEEISAADEQGLVFIGFLLFFDPPKKGTKEIIENMKKAKVEIKVITGDHHLVAAHIAEEIALLPAREDVKNSSAWIKQFILTGEEIKRMSDSHLARVVHTTTIFAEVEPNQKERIILALRKSGKVIGYLGDGINDATALHAADVGISVDSGADVSKEVADIVLLKKDLSVLLRGIQEGRRTFANTMKYIFMATSANFGNMFSMAGASLFLPFLPLLPKQILLTNLLTDCPEMTIAADSVDPDTIDHPVSWDLHFIRRFMIVFGLISSIFDFLTFGVLLYVMKATPDTFRTGWFIESVISASIIVLVVRTKKPFYASRPSFFLTCAVGSIVLLTLLLPFTGLAPIIGFVPLPMSFCGVIAVIVAVYILSSEVA